MVFLFCHRIYSCLPFFILLSSRISYLVSRIVSRISYLVSRIIVSRISYLVSRISYLVSRISYLVQFLISVQFSLTVINSN
ncbi:hypothetical protein OH492_27200 [Vibrio chagasii]|nr:hypothetical protein [Vibrio chagasii]